MRRVLKWALVSAAILGGLFIAWKLAVGIFKVIRPDPVPVTVYRASRGVVEETVTNSKAGTVKARRRAKISPEIGGRAAFIGFRPGDRVRKGEILLKINARDLEAALALAMQDLATSRASAQEACLAADLAQRDLKRTLGLKDDRIVSAEMLDRLQSQSDAAAARCQAARANVERAQAAIDLARANLNKAVLRAPFDGVIADLKAEVGEWVSPSPPAMMIPPVFDIIDPTSIYVSAPLDEVDAGRVATGQPARISLDPYPNRSFKGRVARVAPYVQDIQEQNRTFEVDVDFEDANFTRTLLPGTSADIEIILKAVENVLRMPTYALLEGDRVLVFNGGHLKAVPVKTGMRNWEFTEIREGLQENDPVVVSLDRAEVKEGVRAEIRDEMSKPKDGT
ncbi:MAG TPA: efflux RND transporter periplasmic adaptor subunit [Candidatus Polarisedimenticolia bacterium]|jgi:HlyD family secretion protein|nr:efflux RND transporter periplasmic adaptor subunit [Candidatus Polarisedimenticolia bacterium]